MYEFLRKDLAGSPNQIMTSDIGSIIALSPLSRVETTSGPRVSESVVLLLHRVEFDVRYFR